MLLFNSNTWRWIEVPGVCDVSVLSKHKLVVLVTSPAEPIGSIMKRNINMGENKSRARKRERREVERERDSKAREADAGI